jgi:hypothetical protein
LVSRYFPELMALIGDLPGGPFGRLPWHPTEIVHDAWLARASPGPGCC